MRDFDEDSYVIGDLKHGMVMSNSSQVKSSYREDSNSITADFDL